MYHGTTTGRKEPSSEYSISSSRFVAQLDLLKTLGWQTACVRDLADVQSLPPLTVIITFDDGLANTYAGAFEPLMERAMRATWFVVTGSPGAHAKWLDAPYRERAMLDHTQLITMAQAGMEIGCHTRTHPDLTTLDALSLREEIAGARADLRDLLAEDVVSFAYPYGRFNRDAVDAVRAAGFSFACSTRPGWLGATPDPYLLRRVTIFRNDSLGSFARKLAFAANDVRWRRMTKYAFNRIAARLDRRASDRGTKP